MEPEQENVHPAKRLMPPYVLLAAVLLSLALDRWLPLFHLWQRPWTYLGGATIIAALAVNVFLALGFKSKQTTIIPFQESTTLITGGLYRFSRNPIYLSMVVLLYGVAISLGSLSPWIVPTLFGASISWLFIQREEEMLTEKFGDQYRSYCQQVRRWL